MNSYTTYDSVISTINELRVEMNRKAKKQFTFSYTIIFLVVIILSIVLYSTGLEWYVPISVMGSSIFLMVLIYFIAATTRNNKLKNEYLNQELMNLYNSQHDMDYIYEYKANVDKQFNIDMGLFTRHASISSKFVITSGLNNDAKYNIFRCTMTTSDGKNTTTHFDGFYIRIPIDNIPRQQLRSKGKPHIKGIKMTRLGEYEDKIFVPEDQPTTHPDSILYSIFQAIPRTFETHSYYVASDLKEVAVAISLKHKFKLPKELDYQSLQEYSEPLFELLRFADEVAHQILEGEYE
ncbi:hypothetical protein [Candidatus Xianfuyuplasma coldseepsis]|uniref:DUF3137 domain-containing protein n=1 Tax=Candidatus Xianfuyuplasma coldseepsis TaxID=2782163 RepID=A0A7L7KPK8_9MOLU|nr:hypothetical protein [Xianfuyuplasma coldseepsis]QMS84721.1 hypothetical protein G4Z02_02785 [Xianfuyuplasma coldseepsis]